MGAFGRAGLALALVVGALPGLASAKYRAPDPRRTTFHLDRRAQPAEGWFARDKGFAGQGWWPLVEQAPADGVLRVELSDPHDVDLTVLFRARRDAVSGLEHSYGLGIASGRLRFVAWNGIAFTPRGRGGKWPKRGFVEIVITQLGGQVVADVYDANGNHLTQARADGMTGGGQLLGLFGGPTWGEGEVTSVSTRAACPVGRAPRFSQYHIRKGNLVATVDPQVEFARMNPLDPTPLGLEVRTDVYGLEALFCAGTPARALREELPWKYVQGSYLRERHRAPRRRGRAFVMGDAYLAPQQVADLLQAWHARYPKRTRLETLGTSHQGRPILALAIANGLQLDDPRPSVLLNGTHHGDEPMSTVFVLDAIEQLLAGPHRRLSNNAVVWAVPLVNPDGAHTFFELTKDGARKNGHDLDADGVRENREGVDLNRNYPFAWGTLQNGRSTNDHDSRYFRGDAPASEPETRAMMALAHREHFIASISFHTGTIAVLAPYTMEGVENPRPNEAWQIAEQIVERAGPHPQGRAFGVSKNLYPVDGADQDWLRHAHGTIALLIEGARWSPLTKKDRDAVLDAVRPMWVHLVDRAGWGPAIHGRITFAGEARPATVKLDRQTLNANEVWLARERDGRFHRMLAKPGRHSVTVTAEGYAPQTKEVWVGRRPAKLAFELLPLAAAH